MEVKMVLDGKNIGTLNSTDVQVETEYDYLKNGNSVHVYGFIKSMSYYAKLEDVKFDPEFFKIHTPEKMYKLVGTGWKLQIGKRMPKTKRLLKKYKKKYSYTIEMDNVLIK